MDALKHFRFARDVPYDILVPPLGLDYYNMTPRQASENFHWFLDHIPERMDYFRARCAQDLSVPLEQLNYQPESLLPVWQWFLKTAKTERTSKEVYKSMISQIKLFGEDYVPPRQFTVATQFILRDVGIYLAQCLLSNYPQLRWYYFTKPKSNVSAKRPLLVGFRVPAPNGNGTVDYFCDPIVTAESCAVDILTSKQTKSDLYQKFLYWRAYIPKTAMGPVLDESKKSWRFN